MTSPPSYRVFVSRKGNVFMRELAHLLASALTDLGRTVDVTADGLPGDRSRTVDVVVAPHEFFELHESASSDRLLEAAAASVCVTTEQVHTPWFALGQRYTAQARLSLDINESATAELARRGVPAHHLPLGYHRSLDHWGGDEARERPLDVTVLAATTERREQVLSRAIPLLWDRSCDIRLFTFDQPVTEGSDSFLAGKAKLAHLAGTKVLLNIHRGDEPYFEWLRMVEAVANGCLVVTEPSLDHRPLVAFEDFVQCPSDLLGAYADAALVDEGWRRDVTRHAYERLRSERDFTQSVGELLSLLDDAAAPSRRRRALEPLAPVVPDRVTPPTSEPPPLLDQERRALAAVKELMLSERTLARSVEAVQAALRHNTTEAVATEVTPAYGVVDPSVSVVLSVYNYATPVLGAMASVVASTGVEAELIVVDDHSEDTSAEVIRAFMADHPWFPVRAVFKEANQGLSRARNAGFALARSEYVFVLDADNVVYPTGLARLREALEARPDAPFAYGIIDRFGDGEGLVSHLPWNVARLVQTNYIDAMAMVRRSAWAEVGGFNADMDEQFGGWEDYDLWLTFAAMGRAGALVRAPVGRYRVHGTSMLADVNLETDRAVLDFRRRHATLPWPAR